jgi:hypothetical protein
MSALDLRPWQRWRLTVRWSYLCMVGFRLFQPRAAFAADFHRVPRYRNRVAFFLLPLIVTSSSPSCSNNRSQREASL